MYNLTKEEKLNFILKNQKELKISANTISKNTDLTEAGVQRILKGISKNPQEKSLNKIVEYIISLTTGSNLHKEATQEAEADYIKIPNTNELQQEIINCFKEIKELTKENTKLKDLLDQNNINY